VGFEEKSIFFQNRIVSSISPIKSFNKADDKKRKPFKKSKESKKIKTFLALGERPKE
jgi:peptide methionine sulfoxide reductase MsrA